MLTLENDIINRNKITNRTLRLWWLRVLLVLGSICTCSSFRLLSSSMNHGGVQNLHHKHQYHNHPCESKRSVLEPMLAVRWNNYHCLFMSGEKEEESSFSLNDNDNDNDNKEAKILETLYSRTSLVFGFASALLFLIPDKTLTKRLATKWGGAAGFGLASYASRILQQQVQRTTSSTATSPTTSVSSGSSLLLLSNDTYKRWNLGLCGFCVLAIPSVPGEAWFWPSPAAAIGTSLILTATRIFGAMVFYRGWKFGFVSSSSVAAAAASVSTSSRVTQELWQGWKKNWKGIRVCTKPKASLFYRNSLLVVLFAMFSNLMEGIFHMRYREALTKTAFDISIQWSGVARLFLISSMLYSLKDAGEKDLLSDPTFVRMNFMLASWGFLVGLGQCIVPFGFSLRHTELFAFSIMLSIKGWKGLRERTTNFKPKTGQE